MASYDPLVQDLVISIQKRPLLRMLREWREDSTDRVEVELLNEIIDAVNSGDFDG